MIVKYHISFFFYKSQAFWIHFDMYLTSFAYSFCWIFLPQIYSILSSNFSNLVEPRLNELSSDFDGYSHEIFARFPCFLVWGLLVLNALCHLVENVFLEGNYSKLSHHLHFSIRTELFIFRIMWFMLRNELRRPFTLIRLFKEVRLRSASSYLVI